MSKTLDQLCLRIQEIQAENRAMRGLGMKLWKLNETTGYWDYQRNVTPETADEWRRRFQIDEPTATFRVSKAKPIPPTLQSAIRREYAERAASPAGATSGGGRKRLRA